MNTTFFKRAAYAALISGMFLTSCSDDVMDDDKKGGTDETQYEQGYVSFSFINATAVGGDTRAEGDLEAGSSDESKLNSGIVVLYTADASNEKDNTVAYQFVLGAEGDSGNGIAGAVPGANGEKKYTTKAQKVDKKAYKLAIFLNAPTALVNATKAADADAGTAAKTIANMQTALQLTATDANSVTGNVATLIGGSSDNFLMSNFAGLVEVAPSYIKSTDAAAEADPVSLFVERAVAKLAVAYKSDIGDLNSAFKFSAVTWAPDVLAKQTYWMRKQTKRLDDNNLTNGSTASSTIDEVVGIKPLYRMYMYAESPDFEKASKAAYNNKAISTDPSTAISTRYNYITTSDVTKTIGTIAYVPENTMTAAEQYEDITTSIVIKAVFAPATTTLGATLGTAGTESYFVYKSKVFSLAELESIFDDSFSSSGKDWADYEAVNPDLAGFQALLQSEAAKTALGGTNKDYKSGPSTSVKYEAGGITFYKGGVNFYNVPVRHFGEGLQPAAMAYGRYGVVRNNVYKLTLSSINNFGDIKIPDKKYPDDKESYLSAQFQILPWIVREQNIIL